MFPLTLRFPADPTVRCIRITLLALGLASASLSLPACDSRNNTPRPSDATSSSGSPTIELLNARARAVPPGVRISAAYMDIKNNGDQPDRLRAVRLATPAGGRAEIHETVVDDAGVMRMRELTEGAVIPAARTVEFKPGGLHIMLLELTAEPQPGDTMELELDFEHAGRRTVTARVFSGD